mmetsp:Transcript_61168/g.122618  ORF Transcript_61168/g.122618 Transcript_61168/m.122618 type:complete len:110 (+) Transcript_61168:585-914(+)
MQDLQRSVARTCAARAYCPHYGEILAGCALCTSSGIICGGSSIGTWSGYGGVSPLAAALVSLGGKGLGTGGIVDAVWVAERDSPEVQSLRSEDEALLKSLSPGASFLSG